MANVQIIDDGTLPARGSFYSAVLALAAAAGWESVFDLLSMAAAHEAAARDVQRQASPLAVADNWVNSLYDVSYLLRIAKPVAALADRKDGSG